MPRPPVESIHRRSFRVWLVTFSSHRSRRSVLKLRSLAVLCLALLLSAIPAFAQTDPGPRGGGAAAGAPLSSVAANSPSTILSFFNDAKDRFEEVDTVALGLGPRFNSRSCAACHAQPATGGTS